MVRTLMTVVLLIVLGAGLSSCGSSKKASSTGSGGTTIEAQDYRLVPNTMTATAGSQVRFTFKNKGSMEHNFSLTEANVSTDAEKGASATVSFTAPSAPGSYEFFCKYHKTRGMTGTLTVT